MEIELLSFLKQKSFIVVFALVIKLFNTINYLFENEQINLEQKLSLKQLLISDSENVINRLYKFKETNFPLNTNLKSIFKKFLISELENL